MLDSLGNTGLNKLISEVAAGKDPNGPLDSSDVGRTFDQMFGPFLFGAGSGVHPPIVPLVQPGVAEHTPVMPFNSSTSSYNPPEAMSSAPGTHQVCQYNKHDTAWRLATYVPPIWTPLSREALQHTEELSDAEL